ncbi:MAG TPA: DUF1223 domain-containing protein [Alphaproteobacteria bacterium]|nr:DUF1223 domain-containing protein [Alphaproteobacteria bacterium]
MKKKTHFLLFGVCLLIAAWLSFGRGNGVSASVLPETPLTGPVVVELFTSQGCSSCPPADEYLHQLSTRAHVIALSCHVTYWDRLGWDDTLGRDFCGERQGSYSTAQGRGGGVFTPEMVVNGVKSVIGNKSWMIVNALKVQDGRVKPISIVKEDDGSFRVALPAHNIAQNHPTRIVAFFYRPDETVPIGRGENSGQTLTYVRPVLSMSTLLGHWDGQNKTLSIKKSNIPDDAAGFAVIVQRGENADGAIIEAGEIRFRN